LSALKGGQRPVVYGDGEQTRDFVYVDDVVEANLGAALAPVAAGNVYNFNSGRSVALNVILSQLAGLVGVDPRPVDEPARADDLRFSVADVESARRNLGIECIVGNEAGLARVVMATNRSA
jgi:nucleoside-diphosphate-sugar epimerase